MLLLKIKSGKDNLRIEKISNFPCTIGRAIENDIVLQDPCVSAYHCQFEKNSENKFLLNDLESANGSILNGKKVLRQEIKNKSTLQLGATSIEIFLASEDLEPTQIISIKAERFTVGQKIAFAGSLWLVLFLVSVAKSFFLFEMEWDEVLRILMTEMFKGMAVVVIAVFLSIFNKVHNRVYKVFSFLFPIFCFLLASLFFQAMIIYFHFLTSAHLFFAILDITIDTALVVGLGYSILSVYAKPGERRWIKYILGTVGVFVVFSFGMDLYKYSDGPRFDFNNYKYIYVPSFILSLRSHGDLQPVFKDLDKSFNKVGKFRDKYLQEKEEERKEKEEN